MDCLAREKEARLNIERSQASLSEELARAQRDLLSANQKVKQIINSNSLPSPILFFPFPLSYLYRSINLNVCIWVC